MKPLVEVLRWKKAWELVEHHTREDSESLKWLEHFQQLDPSVVAAMKALLHLLHLLRLAFLGLQPRKMADLASLILHHLWMPKSLPPHSPVPNCCFHGERKVVRHRGLTWMVLPPPYCCLLHVSLPLRLEHSPLPRHHKRLDG